MNARETQAERALAEWLEQPDAVVTRSGREAFLAMLLAREIGHGDEILLPVTVCATLVNAVLVTGATPVLVDCRPDHAACPDDMERRVTDRTRLALVHHPFGLAIDLTPHRRALAGYGVPLVEDCAQAIGAHYAGRPVGHQGEMALFSFGPRKPFDAQGGGLAVAACRDELSRIRLAARVGAPGYPDDRALGIDSLPHPEQIERILASFARFARDLDHKLAKAEPTVARLARRFEIVGLDAIGHRPCAHVLHRVIVALPRPGVGEGLTRLAQTLSPRLMLGIQGPIPRPLYAMAPLLGGYRKRDRGDLCDPRGQRFPGWHSVAQSHLCLRTTPEVSRADLLTVARALERLFADGVNGSTLASHRPR